LASWREALFGAVLGLSVGLEEESRAEAQGRREGILKLCGLASLREGLFKSLNVILRVMGLRPAIALEEHGCSAG